MNEILSQFTFKDMSMNILFYVSILIGSCLGFMHPTATFFDGGRGYLVPKWKVIRIAAPQKQPTKDEVLAENLYNGLLRFIQAKISENPKVSFVYMYRIRIFSKVIICEYKNCSLHYNMIFQRNFFFAQFTRVLDLLSCMFLSKN